MSDDWFRNKAWNSRIEEAFFSKLSRARSQRDQYLVIQASTIAAIDPDAALKLVDLYFDTRIDRFQDMSALHARADALLTMDRLAEAILAYKDVLIREAEFPNVRSNTSVELPYLIAVRRLDSEYDFALETLGNSLDEGAFPIIQFLWQASNALIADDLKQHEMAREFAEKAVQIADIKRSGFRYHQSLGLVGKEYKPILKRLVRIAR